MKNIKQAVIKDYVSAQKRGYRYTLTQTYTRECQSTEANVIDCIEVYGDTTGKVKWKKQNTNYALNLPVIVLTSFINSFCSITFQTMIGSHSTLSGIYPTAVLT